MRWRERKRGQHAVQDENGREGADEQDVTADERVRRVEGLKANVACHGVAKVGEEGDLAGDEL